MEIKIEKLANEMKISIEKLIQQCKKAGIIKTKYNYISKYEKKVLEEYLKNINSISKNTLILKRKTRSTLSIPNSGGKNKYIHVEIRKKKIYSKCDETLKSKTLKTTNEIVKKNLNNVQLTRNQNNRNKDHSYKNSFQDGRILSSSHKMFENNKRKISNIPNIVGNKKIFLKKTKLKSNLSVQNFDIEKKQANKNNNKGKFLTNDKRHVKKHIFQTDYINNSVNNNITFNTRLNDKKNKIKVHRQKNIERTKNLENIRKSVRVQKNNEHYKNSTLKQIFKKPSSIVNRNVTIGSIITISELANKMAIKSSKLINVMTQLGYIITTVHQSLDRDIAQLVAEEMGHKVTICYENELEKKIMENRNVNKKNVETRPPIVTIMGHVDHGKTSLLDYIRLTKVASQESGGITQHIGAYHITVNNKIITFLDTPGHAAFTAMRARGAKVTDIVVLVVAADDGVKPQTIEAIQHAKAASVPILVAINKIDKLDSEPEKVKNELIKHNIVPEEWGGENIFVHISAKSGEGIEDLLKSILIQSEMLELKATFEGMATGSVIEASLDKGNGPSATILIQEGTLNKGDIVLCGLEYGKIRVMKDLKNKEIQSASPSIPVKILGLSGIPISGDKIIVVKHEKDAREVALYRQKKIKENLFANKKDFKLSDIFKNIKRDNLLNFNIILKSDVQGSLEAISNSLQELSNKDIKVKIIGKGVGNITETDASLALASNSIIIGFNVKLESSAKRIIEVENLNCRCYSVIYHIFDEVKKAMHGMKSPKHKKKTLGLAKVRNTFKSRKFGNIAGCTVLEGIIRRNDLIQIIRNNKVIYNGELESLKRFKEDVNKVKKGIECGIGIKNYNDICINDLIEAFCTLEIK